MYGQSMLSEITDLSRTFSHKPVQDEFSTVSSLIKTYLPVHVLAQKLRIECLKHFY
jgi:hypothetical protein